HRLVAMARIGREVLPFLPLMRDAEEQVARLVELHADDAATRARDPRLLATALVVLATAAVPAAGPAGLADFMAGLHVISVLLLSELHEATGEPPAAILQRLAIQAVHGRGTP